MKEEKVVNIKQAGDDITDEDWETTHKVIDIWLMGYELIKENEAEKIHNWASINNRFTGEECSKATGIDISKVDAFLEINALINQIFKIWKSKGVIVPY
jgi:hypothetical protein